jgi:hypothetical protein
VSYAPHDPQPTNHRLPGNPRRRPEAPLAGCHVDLQASGFLNRGFEVPVGAVILKGHASSTFGSERGGSLCNNCPSEFSECADVHRANGVFKFLYVGLVCDHVLTAPRPNIKIVLCKQSEKERDGGHRDGSTYEGRDMCESLIWIG